MSSISITWELIRKNTSKSPQLNDSKDRGTCVVVLFFFQTLYVILLTLNFEEKKNCLGGVWSPRFYISNKFPGHSVAACPYTIVFSSEILRDVYIILRFFFFHFHFFPFFASILAFYPTITLALFFTCAVG